MRCPSCRSYIPEGLGENPLCPQCGKRLEAAAPAQTMAREEPVETPSAQPFAPFFSIRARLSFGPTTLPGAEPGEGSISFGREGFGIVSDRGRRWEKLHYRDLGSARAEGSDVFLSVRDVESRISFYPSGRKLLGLACVARLGAGILRPLLGSRLGRPSRGAAAAFAELLSRVKGGLSPAEIADFQKRIA